MSGRTSRTPARLPPRTASASWSWRPPERGRATRRSARPRRAGASLEGCGGPRRACVQQELALAVKHGTRRASPEGLWGVAGQPRGAPARAPAGLGADWPACASSTADSKLKSAHGGPLSALGSGAHGPANWRQAGSDARQLAVAAGCWRMERHRALGEAIRACFAPWCARSAAGMLCRGPLLAKAGVSLLVVWCGPT